MTRIANKPAETITFPCELTVIHCGCCGGIYAINEKYRKQCYQDSKAWNCPYCQVSWGYSGPTPAAKLEKQLMQERARHDQDMARARERRELVEKQLATTEAQRRAEKGAKTRLKNRAAGGLCPCCNRNFASLSEHVRKQHPDFYAESGRKINYKPKESKVKK